MKKSIPQILPSFKNVQLLTNDVTYNQIYESSKTTKSAWLISENDSMWEFIENLGKADIESDSDEPLNLYEFYVAYNVKFPTNVTTITLSNKSQVLKSDLKDFHELLDSVIKTSNSKQQYIFIKNNVNYANELNRLKLRIMQQFIYLRMYLPVIIADSLDEAKTYFENGLNQTETKILRDIAILGTKKAGKSTLINALVNDEYAVSSRKLLTPNKIVYSAATNTNDILLRYKNANTHFPDVKSLQTYLIQEFETANKDYKALEEMQIFIPSFPKYLQGFRLIDTPASNFALNEEHIKTIKKVISETDCVIFVMNYSTHLTDDEVSLFDEVYKKFNEKQSKQPILIAINHVDEIFASEEVKSYERLEDYIQNRLSSLGYSNFLVLSLSALQAVYCNQIAKMIMSHTFWEKLKNFIQNLLKKNPSLKEQLQRLKNKYRKTDHLTGISFIMNIILDFKDFHGIIINDINELQETHRIGYLKHLINYML